VPVPSGRTNPGSPDRGHAKTIVLVDAARQSVAIRYLIAILAALGAVYLRKLLAPLLGSQYPYHTLWLAVIFSAWYCGLGLRSSPSPWDCLDSGIGFCRPTIPSLL
jgi:hypothetical protein